MGLTSLDDTKLFQVGKKQNQTYSYYQPKDRIIRESASTPKFLLWNEYYLVHLINPYSGPDTCITVYTSLAVHIKGT